jgi:hypothetical protein
MWLRLEKRHVVFHIGMVLWATYVIIYIYIIYVSCDILLLLLFLFIISIYYCRLLFLLFSIIYYYLFLLLWNACLFIVGDMLIYSFFAIYNQPPVESIIYRYIVGICKSGFIRSYIANI